ncbi:MAG: cytochrome c [Balneolaceae bacterium]|nr:cytochrome c [Balneolaceae bacterium]
MNKKTKRFTISQLLSTIPFWVISLSLILMTACSDGGSTAPNNNDSNTGNNNNNNNEIGLEPTFTNVVQIFTQNCGSCHIGGSQNGVRLDSYENVMNSVGDQYGTEVVQPDNADASPLVDKIEPNPQFDSRMPEGGPFLSSDRIDQIKEWINQGAEDN